MTNYKKKDQKTVLEVIFLGVIRGIWWLIKLPFGKERGNRGLSQSDKSFVVERRLEIESRLNKSNNAELSHLLFEADKLVDYYLKGSGAYGDTFADRLRSSEGRMDHSTYESLWQAHKLRNKIAHEANIKIGEQEILAAINKLLNYLKNV